MRLRPLLVFPAIGVIACQHADGTAALGRPTAELIQKLIEREHAISLHNGYVIDQANIFAGGGEIRHKVSRSSCSELGSGRFDCRFMLTRSIGSDRSTDSERRTIWKQSQAGWTTNLIEELCSQQRQALGTTDCVGIVDE